MSEPLHYRRCLLKLGGESLSGEGGSGIVLEETYRTADRVAGLAALGAEIALVLGGGNLVRGKSIKGGDVQSTTADAVGMLATVMNALALADALEARGREARVMSAFPVGGFTELFSAAAARRHLAAGRIVLAAGGTGNPFFTTDTNAALRAIEVGAELMIKATKVNGVFSADPKKNEDAVRFDTLTYKELIERDLDVMDITAVTLCKENDLPVMVCNFWQEGAVAAVLRGDRRPGTWIGS